MNRVQLSRESPKCQNSSRLNENMPVHVDCRNALFEWLKGMGTTIEYLLAIRVLVDPVVETELLPVTKSTMALSTIDVKWKDVASCLIEKV